MKISNSTLCLYSDACSFETISYRFKTTYMVESEVFIMVDVKVEYLPY